MLGVLVEARGVGELEGFLDHGGDAHVVFAGWSRGCRRGTGMVFLGGGGGDEWKDAGVGVGVSDGLFGDDVSLGHLQTGAARAAARLPRTLSAEDEATTDGKGDLAQVIFLEKAPAGNVGGDGWRCRASIAGTVGKGRVLRVVSTTGGIRGRVKSNSSSSIAYRSSGSSSSGSKGSRGMMDRVSLSPWMRVMRAGQG